MNAKQFRRLQDKALRPLLKKIRALFHARGVPVTDPQIAQMALQLYRPVVLARQRNYNVGLAYLNTQRLPPTRISPPRHYPLEALNNTITEIAHDLRIEDEPLTESNRRDTRVIEVARKAVEGTVARVAQEPARELIQEVGEDEDLENVGWARMLVGAYSCSFCAMLASRGPVYKSRETAIGRGGNPLDAYHKPYIDKRGALVGGVCDCIAVLVTSWGTWEGRDAFEKLENLWQDTGGKASGHAARLKFRREWDRQVRAGETGQYLADSLGPSQAA
jgi:hypothetical protein